MRQIKTVSALVALATPTCAQPNTLANQGTWSGVFTLLYERCEFKADGRKEIWSVDYKEDSPLVKLLNKSKESPFFGSVRVTIKGTLSPIGRFGHLGLYKREIVITEANYAKP